MFLLAFILAFLTVNAQKQNAPTTSLAQLTHTSTPAIQIAYLDKGKIRTYALGLKATNAKDTINSETIFQAASLSKVVATYAFLVLAEKGVLDLDKPLWQYHQYKRLENDTNKHLMTARHVLTHQTGLVNWEENANTAAWQKSELRTRFIPGTNYTYSGEAFYYLQLVAEKLTGKPFNQLCNELVFKPFDMQKSSFIYRDSYSANITLGHVKLTSKNEVQKFYKANAAYTMYTTAHEYMKFIIKAVLNGKGLSKKMHEAFLSPQIKTVLKGKETERDNHIMCCLGIRSQDNEVGRAYWHTGSNGGGFKSIFMVYPKEKKGITIFVNSTTGNTAYEKAIKLFLGENQTYWLFK